MNSVGTFRSVPTLLSHGSLCAGRFDGYLVCPFDFSLFDFFPKIGKALFCRLSERDFRRNPFHKEKAAAEAPPPPSLIGQLSVISQNVSFYRKRQLLQRRSRKQRGLQSKEPSCCYRRSEENRDSQASDRSVFRLPEFQQQPSCTTPPPEIQASQLEQWQSLSIAH